MVINCADSFSSLLIKSNISHTHQLASKGFYLDKVQKPADINSSFLLALPLLII